MGVLLFCESAFFYVCGVTCQLPGKRILLGCCVEHGGWKAVSISVEHDALYRVTKQEWKPLEWGSRQRATEQAVKKEKGKKRNRERQAQGGRVCPVTVHNLG